MIELKKIYEEIQEKIDRLDFDLLWPGFHKKEFALYNDEIVVLNGKEFPKTEEFLANTAIMYEGRYIAIWYLKGAIDITILTSKIVHEMFHAYQLEQNELRFAEEIEGLMHYRYTPEYLQIRYRENVLLKELGEQFQEEKMQEFLSSRKMRKSQFPYEYQYETEVEAIEGAAEYVELQVLKVLDEKKYQKRYIHLMENMLKKEKLIPARAISYDTGALFLLLCKENGLPISNEIGNTTEIFYAKLIEQAEEKRFSGEIDYDIQKMCQEREQELERKVSHIISTSPEVIRGKMELCGFNAYAPWFYQGYIYSEGFLSYKDREQKNCYGNFLFKFENNYITEIYREV